MLPPRIPRKAKRASRWRSQAHLAFIRGFACARCGSMTAIEAAHVRNGSGAGMGQKPDDWRAVSLCRDCHHLQHTTGEQTFWNGHDVERMIELFIKSSPRRFEIEQVRKDRGDG